MRSVMCRVYRRSCTVCCSAGGAVLWEFYNVKLNCEELHCGRSEL